MSHPAKRLRRAIRDAVHWRRPEMRIHLAVRLACAWVEAGRIRKGAAARAVVDALGWERLYVAHGDTVVHRWPGVQQPAPR